MRKDVPHRDDFLRDLPPGRNVGILSLGREERREKERSGMRSAAFSTMAVTGFFWLASVGSANAAPVTVTGCLEKGHEAGEFQLSHATGGDAQQYELIAGKGVDLNAHLGHKVEITGEKASEADEKGGEKKEMKEHAHHHLKVSALRHVAATCP
jgi:hypothetical protein